MNLSPLTLPAPTLSHTTGAGVNLVCRAWHPGGEPVLLLHGLGDTGAVWAGVAVALGDRYHLVAPDLHGHGDSDKPNTGYTFAEIVADLEGLCDRLGWPQAHIVGHSWAGKLAAIWARQHPERFASMVLVDPFFIGSMPGWVKVTFPLFYKILPFLQMLGPFPSAEAAEAKARSLKQYRDWTDLQAAVCRLNLAQRADGTWGSKLAIAARNQIFEDVMRVNGLTEAIAVPTLLVLPEGGLNRTDFQLAPYRRYLTNLREQPVPGNHWACLVEPAALGAAIAPFLASHPIHPPVPG